MMPPKSIEEKKTGDMPPDEFRKYGHQVVDWIADYLENLDRYPVLSPLRPGQVREQLPEAPPTDPEGMDLILADLEEIVVPGITHWNHPSFFSYFSVTGSGPGILGELLCSAFNVNGMLWKTSPAATELEELALDWLRQMLGLPESLFGVIYDTASTSTFHAVAAAREAVCGLNAREKGLAESGLRLRLYTSEEAHSSVEKAAIAIGIGLDGVRKVAVDSHFSMDPQSLEEAIQDDLRNGWTPFCVVATVGTTSTTSVDPVDPIVDISRRYGLWVHVDAAYAGPAAILPERRWILEGSESADSVVTNPHKWLFTPIDISVLYCRRPQVLKDAFSLVPDYLRSSETATNFMDYGVQLGRRFRALKLWMVIRYFGTRGIEQRIRQHIQWAEEFAAWVDQSSEFERLAPTPFSTVCFRAVPQKVAQLGEPAVNSFNERLLDKVNRTGEVFLSQTRLSGKVTLRLAIGNLKTRRSHIENAWGLLRRTCAKLQTENVAGSA